MSRPFQKAKIKTCCGCGKEFLALWARQIYCAPCQGERRSTLNLQSIKKDRTAKSAAFDELRQRSVDNSRPLPGAFKRPDYQWFVTFRIPFANSSSKNRRWAQIANGGGVYIPEHVLNYTALVISETKRAMKGQTIFNNKVWLSFFVQKNDHKSDAVNVVDTLCDAIKVALDVDDRWFSIDMVDWEVKKKEPYIYVKIGQEDCFDARVCSHCGGVFPLDSFHKSKHNKLGVGRECRECKRVVSAKRAEVTA